MISIMIPCFSVGDKLGDWINCRSGFRILYKLELGVYLTMTMGIGGLTIAKIALSSICGLQGIRRSCGTPQTLDLWNLWIMQLLVQLMGCEVDPQEGNKILEWHTTCFLRIEMHYLGPWKNRMSTWIVIFYSSLEACMPYPWIVRGSHTYEFGDRRHI